MEKKVVSKQLEHSKEQLERIENEVNEGAKPVSDLYDIQVLYTQEKKIALQTAQEEANKKHSYPTGLTARSIVPQH